MSDCSVKCPRCSSGCFFDDNGLHQWSCGSFEFDNDEVEIGYECDLRRDIRDQRRVFQAHLSMLIDGDNLSLDGLIEDIKELEKKYAPLQEGGE